MRCALIVALLAIGMPNSLVAEPSTGGPMDWHSVVWGSCLKTLGVAEIRIARVNLNESDPTPPQRSELRRAGYAIVRENGEAFACSTGGHRIAIHISGYSGSARSCVGAAGAVATLTIDGRKALSLGRAFGNEFVRSGCEHHPDHHLSLQANPRNGAVDIQHCTYPPLGMTPGKCERYEFHRGVLTKLR